MNLVGELLVGEYDITEALGHGATSVVYKAVRTTDKNVFAIKILHSYLVVNEEKRKRFEQEARALLLLSHPHIVKIHSFDKTTDDQPFFVMDFIPGQTLSDLVNGAPLTIPQSWKIFIEIADAMTHAHNR
ncbi:serine/threonine protein kinase, partial [Corallococcus carmarthensis]|uniref:serine/threonine protein kinase n=1 Tax=Corallococcus carmarthensis TaxID=2316728 RepID=UPI0011C38397